MDDITPVLNGQTLHGIDAFGVRWKTTLLTGWWESTESTGDTYQNQMAAGGWIDEAFDSSRVLVVGGTIRGPNRPAAREALARLMRALPLSAPRPFSLTEDGLTRYVLARKQSKPVIDWESDTLVTWNIQLSAPEPRRFSGDGSTPFTYSASTGLPTSTGGLQVGVQVPLQVQATTVSGSVKITNAGDATPPVRVTITGPVVNPIIRSAAGGLMQFNISLDAGQTLVVDLDKHTVKINGTVNRRNALAGSWIVPTAGTVLSFDASSYNSAAQMSVQWSDAWS